MSNSLITADQFAREVIAEAKKQAKIHGCDYRDLINGFARSMGCVGFVKAKPRRNK